MHFGELPIPGGFAQALAQHMTVLRTDTLQPRRGDDLIGCANGSKGYDANDQPENDASKPDELTAPGPGRAVRGLSDVVVD